MENLREQIAELIKKSNQGIRYNQFMEMALYHPTLGYYAKPVEIGKRGDFFTSVSVGPCFGGLLARQIRQIWEELGQPSDFSVVEQGAHDGRLALDILTALDELGCPLNYAIVEPNPAFRFVQDETLGARLTAHPRELGDLRLETGFFVANELLDAFPVDRLRFESGEWRDLLVTLEDDQFVEMPFSRESPPPSGFPAEIQEGFTTEICPGFLPWTEALGQIFERGVALIIDYGLTAEEFFEPERANGTLRCYRDHQSPDSPFESIGQTDLTSQVNFTHVSQCAEEVGFRNLGLIDQARFLTGIAADWLLELEGASSHPLVRQFQTLTHPGSMGKAFHVLGLAKNFPDSKLDGFKFAR